MTKPKITIIIPTRNGGKYLPYCVNSVLSQSYKNLELIISVNHSSDNTYEYVKTINDSRVKIISPDKELNMTEHYEYALSKSTGDWIMFLGDDDAVMPYFFEIVPHLINSAECNNIHAINSLRAYFYWKGCEEMYSNSKISYDARAIIKIKSVKEDLFRCLLNYKKYFDTPQMYTSSLFSKEFIEKIKSKQNGLFYNSYPPDANASAIYMSTEEKYLYCEIPLSWVGTSNKSYGLTSAYTTTKKIEFPQDIKRELKSLEENKLYKWHPLAGNQALLTVNLHLWNSLLYCDKLQSEKLIKQIRSKIYKYFMFAGSYYEVKRITDINSSKTKMEYVNEILDLNKCSALIVKFIADVILPHIYAYWTKKDKKESRKDKKISTTLFYKNFNPECDFTITDANNRISEIGVSNILIKSMIEKI